MYVAGYTDIPHSNIVLLSFNLSFVFCPLDVAGIKQVQLLFHDVKSYFFLAFVLNVKGKKQAYSDMHWFWTFANSTFPDSMFLGPKFANSTFANQNPLFIHLLGTINKGAYSTVGTYLHTNPTC